MTTLTELEPTHIFEGRVSARLADATRAATDAAAAEEAASAVVSAARGDYRIGIAPRGPWDAASKKLAKAQAARADADAALKAIERNIARQREGRHAVEVVAQRAERRELEALKADSKIRAAELWQRVFTDLAEIDQLPGLPPLSSAGRAYDAAIGSLTQLRRLFSGK